MAGLGAAALVVVVDELELDVVVDELEVAVGVVVLVVEDVVVDEVVVEEVVVEDVDVVDVVVVVVPVPGANVIGTSVWGAVKSLKSVPTYSEHRWVSSQVMLVTGKIGSGRTSTM